MRDKILTCHLHNEAAVCSVTASIRRRVKYLIQPDCKIDGGRTRGYVITVVPELSVATGSLHDTTALSLQESV